MSSTARQFTTRIVLVISAVLMLSHCAKQGMPGGGPVDTIPPRILDSAPASGSTNVPRDAKLSVRFSESVARDRLPAQVLVTPLSDKPLQFGWSKQTVEIQWPDSLLPQTTYRVVFGPKINDQHGVEMGNASTITFSTGDVIDSGMIKGRALSLQGQPRAGIGIRAFLLDDSLPDASPLIDGTIPEYLTVSGTDGTYTFDYMPPSRYSVFALDDKNNNHRRDGGEQFGVASRLAVIESTTDSVTALDIYVQTVDTARFELVRCRVDPAGILTASVSRSLDEPAWRSQSWFIAIPDSLAEDSVVQISPVSTRGIPAGSSIELLTRGLRPGGRYNLRVVSQDSSLAIVDSIADQCEFFAPSISDTLGPTVKDKSPAPGAIEVPLGDTLTLVFSEPIREPRETALTLTDSLGNVIPGQLRLVDALTIGFVPAGEWPPNRAILADLDSALVTDRAGNALLDASTAWTFRTQNPDDFGGLAGHVRVATGGYQGFPCILQFKSQARFASKDTTVTTPTAFEISLPAGRYTITAFLDLDRNGRFSPGGISPFRFAEPRIVAADTVEVRSRFVTDGADVVFPVQAR